MNGRQAKKLRKLAAKIAQQNRKLDYIDFVKMFGGTDPKTGKPYVSYWDRRRVARTIMRAPKLEKQGKLEATLMGQ
jgi:hypothetical protein